WADGLTVIYSDRAVITNNSLGNNSDVALILGGGRDAYVANNRITQFGQVAFAGLMLFNFENQSAGDFTNTVVTQNEIVCGASHNCHFGIMLGAHPWNANLQTYGGTVHGNTVSDALQGINVEGAGTILAPVTLYNNPVSGTPSSGVFLCGTRQTSPLNIYTPHSVVNRNGDTTPATNWLWHDCP
ncbi:MAG TPA: right-handed parallel beta-helix repeat-containing protein, partial [Thermoanaerobaculia bacterium]|nr:right-handed parallel beta-helix repeat-containing protein [Thermoanaerobaculia bacterium]